MPAKIIILNGKQAGSSYTLNPASQNLIGREGSCGLVLEDPACSRVHATIWKEDEQWQVGDRVSANGTYHNGTRVTAAELADGDKLLIGGTWLRFVNVPEPVTNVVTGSPPTWILEDSVNPETSLTAVSSPPSDESRRRDLNCVELVSIEIARQTDPHVLAQVVLQILCEHLRAAGAKIFWAAGRNVLAEYQRSTLPVLTEQTIQQAMQTSEAVLVPNPDGQPTSRNIFAPLKYMKQLIGVIWVAETMGRSSFRHEDLCLVASIAHVLAPPLKMLLDMQLLQRKHDSLVDITTTPVVGRSPAMQRVLQMVARVADVDHTILLRGESGVGKEVIARLIHETGSRREQPMVCVNCAALSEALLESELFGHEKGAFTGAYERRPGKFEMADGGTIFLDEIGCLSLTVQAKLLRILEGHSFERVGGYQPIQVNVRVLAATNANLEEMIADLRFREDLYHRLRVIEVVIPPLRERLEDVSELAHYFLKRFCQQAGRQLVWAPGAVELLNEQDWPGNVRQLRNTVERAAILCPGPIIDEAHLRSVVLDSEESDEVLPIDEITRGGIERAINQSSNVPAAARLLGMSRSALYRHMKKLRIEPPRQRRDRPAGPGEAHD
ncbi:MAG: Anaerobic nitric oxide reductase transcription regulator NorR [Phycisphaerae bacterium]|nr:Anaerobic nitric oxide reductase transcription regulator NorR [Phycisphaerae bacterium]